MRDFNPLSTGLCSAIDNAINNIGTLLKVAQPFNDFEAEINQEFLTTAKREAEIILQVVEAHERIHADYKMVQAMSQGLINPAATPDE
jgi:hypothetical protein